MLSVFLLAACGGGGTSGPAPALQAVNDVVVATKAKPAGTAGLAAFGPATVDISAGGQQVVLAVGALASGGDAVVWMTLDAGQASLSLQRQDASGTAVGAPVRLAGLYDPLHVAAMVRPNGEVVVAYASTRRPFPNQLLVTTGIYQQRYDASGALLGGEVEVVSLLQDVQVTRFGLIYHSPALVQWADGHWLVGWEFVHRSPLGVDAQVQTRRYGADGQPLGDVRDEGSSSNQEGFTLTAVEPDGLIVGIARRAADNSTNLSFIESDLRHGLSIGHGPANVDDALPIGSFFLPLPDGELVLFSGRSASLNGPVTDAYFRRINRGGNAVGDSDAIASLPLAAVALDDGRWITVRTDTAANITVVALYDRKGRLLTESSLLGNANVHSMHAVALPSGDVVLAFTDGSTRVLTARLVVVTL